jgi:hypothetical protein
MKSNVSDHVKSLKESTEECQNKILIRSVDAAAKVSKILSACESVATEGLENAMLVDERGEEVDGVLDTWQREDATAVETVAGDVQTFAIQMRSSLHSYLNEELVRDGATGQTPTRKQYAFSRAVHATSPHKRLLDRFEQEVGDVHTNDHDDDDSDLYQDRHLTQVPASTHQQADDVNNLGETDTRLFGGVSPMSPSPRSSISHQLCDIPESPESNNMAMTPVAKVVAMTPGSFVKRLTGNSENSDDGDDVENSDRALMSEVNVGDDDGEQLLSKSRSALQAIEACNLDNVVKNDIVPEMDVNKVDKTRTSPKEAIQDMQTPPSPMSESSDVEVEGNVEDDQAPMSPEEVMKMKVSELRNALSERSASQVGNKATLQSRLLTMLPN